MSDLNQYKVDDAYFDNIFNEADKKAAQLNVPLTESPFVEEEPSEDTIEFEESLSDEPIQNEEPHQEEYEVAPKKKRLSQNERYKKQLQETRQQLEEAQAILQQTNLEKQQAIEALWAKENENIETQSKYWNIVAEDYEFALRSALDAGDSARVAELTRKMNESDNVRRDLTNRQTQLANSYTQYRNTAQPQSNNYTVKSTFNEAATEFLERNPFLDPKPGNSNYSPQAVAKVSEISSDLSMQYKMQGRGDEINTQSYFNDLERQMNKEFGRRSQPQQNTRMSNPSPSPRSARMVAPVGKRQTMDNAQPRMNLSKEHKTLMMSLRNEFGSEYDHLLKKAFAPATKGYNPNTDSGSEYF